jgi:hypothetical protein
MAKRAALQFLCVFLLLFAQQGALTHSVWHLRDHRPAHGHQDRAGSAGHHGDDVPSSQSQLCDVHAALGTLLAGECGGHIAATTADFSQWFAPSDAVWRIAQSAVTPPSRAPPVLL